MQKNDNNSEKTVEQPVPAENEKHTTPSSSEALEREHQENNAPPFEQSSCEIAWPRVIRIENFSVDYYDRLLEISKRHTQRALGVHIYHLPRRFGKTTAAVECALAASARVDPGLENTRRAVVFCTPRPLWRGVANVVLTLRTEREGAHPGIPARYKRGAPVPLGNNCVLIFRSQYPWAYVEEASIRNPSTNTTSPYFKLRDESFYDDFENGVNSTTGESIDSVVTRTLTSMIKINGPALPLVSEGGIVTDVLLDEIAFCHNSSGFQRDICERFLCTMSLACGVAVTSFHAPNCTDHPSDEQKPQNPSEPYPTCVSHSTCVILVE